VGTGRGGAVGGRAVDGAKDMGEAGVPTRWQEDEVPRMELTSRTSRPAGGSDPEGIAPRLRLHLAAEARGVRVQDVRIGLGYTAVRLGDGRTGVAYTFRDLARGGCSVFRGARPLVGRLADELLAFLESSDAIEAAVGLACANALANREGLGELHGDILEHLEVTPEDEVAMIGNFAPLLEGLRLQARSLTVFERLDGPGSRELRADHEAPEVLARSSVALITATSLLNGTLDTILKAARNCRVVALLGASTPLVPEVFEGTCVTLLSGVVVHQPEGVLQVVSEGGGMRQFGPSIRKVSLRLGAGRP
jgi:uncharacterized protein (DUF4213/DUF364 family)